MPNGRFPEYIRKLPRVDLPIDGVRGWLSQAPDHQVVFFEIEAGRQIDPHKHGEQWGIVVEGEMELTIEGNPKRYRAGDSYHIPAGAMHSAKFLSYFRTIDVFADVDRYRPLKPATA